MVCFSQTLHTPGLPHKRLTLGIASLVSWAGTHSLSLYTPLYCIIWLFMATKGRVWHKCLLSFPELGSSFCCSQDWLQVCPPWALLTQVNPKRVTLPLAHKGYWNRCSLRHTLNNAKPWHPLWPKHCRLTLVPLLLKPIHWIRAKQQTAGNVVCCLDHHYAVYSVNKLKGTNADTKRIAAYGPEDKLQTGNLVNLHSHHVIRERNHKWFVQYGKNYSTQNSLHSLIQTVG